jgi:hypothetical protein
VGLKKSARAEFGGPWGKASVFALIPERGEQFELRLVAAVPQLGSKFSNRIGTSLLQGLQKGTESVHDLRRKRPGERILVRGRPWSGQSGIGAFEIDEEVPLILGNHLVVAQNLRSEAILRAKFACALDPPLPSVMDHGSTIIVLESKRRNAECRDQQTAMKTYQLFRVDVGTRGGYSSAHSSPKLDAHVGRL